MLLRHSEAKESKRRTKLKKKTWPYTECIALNDDGKQHILVRVVVKATNFTILYERVYPRHSDDVNDS